MARRTSASSGGGTPLRAVVLGRTALEAAGAGTADEEEEEEEEEEDSDSVSDSVSESESESLLLAGRGVDIACCAGFSAACEGSSSSEDDEDEDESDDVVSEDDSDPLLESGLGGLPAAGRGQTADRVAGHETTLLAKLVIAQSKCRLMVGHSGWGSEKSGSSQP
jgi:hypothetical protein